MITSFYNLKLVTNGTISEGKVVLVENGFVSDVIGQDQFYTDKNSIDLQGAYLASGLIDLQIYGSGGKLFGGNPSEAALQQMENDLLQQGTTGFFATIATNTTAIVEQGIEAAKTYRKNSIGNFLGLHLEGPFLNPKRKGAHPEELIQKASVAELKHWFHLAEGEIKMMTIAPELQDEEVLDFLAQQNIILSAGHSNASFSQANRFLKSPVKAVTHLYNAMPQMHHRDPGFIPAIFEQKPFTSIVPDGIHVDFPMIRLAKRELGEKLFLITDAVTETKEGIYQHQFNQNHFIMPDGTLSGSALTMLKGVQNCVEYADISLAEAINMASLYPAQLLKDETKGQVKKGCRADFIIFNADLEQVHTVFNGQILANP
ncbi:N-acetylglucosamine-6-phosphate deacetylase [uncultured Mucilaginibacter sp.]|uniref:N-acetylglucosamine-6-phosphate deacetylase n=1 Tax=uncultured Mucilaginibacter sp. TaxID=797541 RepID=UPI0026313EF0|nr:N-acetylglucosamine-6-phosphate deacetylase [uncultured Mucilaginibacter sp.]